jgi:hypothetical protein
VSAHRTPRPPAGKLAGTDKKLSASIEQEVRRLHACTLKLSR